MRNPCQFSLFPLLVVLVASVGAIASTQGTAAAVADITDAARPPFIVAPGGTRATATYERMKAYLDSVPAIDTHDHLRPFDRLPGRLETDRGNGMNLAGLWRAGYLGWIQPLSPWESGSSFDDWWRRAKHDFDNVRATSFYRYMLPAIQDLYGYDFDRITDDQARELNDRIFANYRDQKWLYHVITERANIELMFNDPNWGAFEFTMNYAFDVLVLRLNPVFRGHHPSGFAVPADDPYLFAEREGLKIESIDDYVAMLDRLFERAKELGVVCIKHTLAYGRTLRFENVSKEAAARAFGRPRADLTAEEIRDFEDFIMWRLCELSAKYDLPFQIHTGHGRLQGSNPILLLDLIAANRQTKFILFHGGFPWVGETGAIVMRHKNVWIDSVWLPTVSYNMAKRAFHEWLDVMPSDRIMWGADTLHAEGIYGTTEFTRRCLAEVLAERIDRGELSEEHARRIGRQILRDNALKLFPQLASRLWKDQGRLEPPPSR